MQREREKEIDFNNQYEKETEKKIKILDDELPKKKVTFNNLIDNIQEDTTKDEIKVDFINDIKGDISFIKEEIFNLKNMINLILNREN